MTKTCKCCKTSKVFEEFDIKKTCRDGRKPICKACRREKYQDNKDVILARRKQARDKIKDTPEFKEERRQEYLKNRDAIKMQQRAYREENKDRVKVAKKQYYEENKEGILATQKNKRDTDHEAFLIKNRQKRQDNLEARRQYDREYSKQRRENDLQYRILGNLRNRIRLSIINKSECTRDLLGCTLDRFVKHLESQFAPEMNWDNYGDYWSIDHIEPCCSFDLRDEEQRHKCFHWSNCRPLSKTENSRKGNTTDREKMRKIDESTESSVLNNNHHINTSS